MSGQIAKNGTIDPITEGVTLLLYYNGTIYQENTWLDWCSWSGSAWGSVPGDPRGSTGPTPPPQATGYRLVFSDDFTSLNLSPNGAGSYNWYNPGMWWEAPAPYANITASNSILTLNWVKGQGQDGSAARWDTSISTEAPNGSAGRTWRYGYFEVRMRWNPVIGSWPAIWMISKQGMQKVPEDGELDIFEGQGKTPTTYYGTLHDWKGGVSTTNSNNAYNLGSVDFTQFHTYGMLWVRGKVTWYFDDRPIITAPTFPIFDQQDYFLIIGSQEGANWFYGDMSEVSAQSLAVNVDWVHVWQQ